jgi:ADP-ribose pyrophosphatase YjhB (NUDIX family)
VAEAKLLPDPKAAGAELLAQDASDVPVYKKLLEEHNIDTSQFGKGEAKTLDFFVAELRSGDARLLLDATEHKKLVRTVNIVLLRLRSPGGLLLVETEETYSDGRHRGTLRLPGTKKEPHENMRQTVERIAQEVLSISIQAIKLDLLNAERFEEEMYSPSYPGVRTVYRKEIVEGVVTISDAEALGKIGLGGAIPEAFSITTTDKQAITKTFNWMEEAVAEEKGMKLKPEGAEAVSALVRAPVGLSEQDLRAYLVKCNVNPDEFGQGNKRTLKEFSDELIKGEAILLQDSEGRPVRVVDVVVLILARKDGEVLIQASQAYPDGSTQVLNRLPGTKRLPDENQFTTVRRILRRHLNVDDNYVTLDKIAQNVEEDKTSPSYPGMRTLYRKRLITAKLVCPDPEEPKS